MVITLYNFKGGCSKTSSVMIMADYFEKKGEKILLVDLDPQVNLSLVYFNYEDFIVNDNYIPTLYDYFYKKQPLSEIVLKYNDNIDVLPSRLEMGEKSNIDTADLLDCKADFYKLFEKYSMVIIDCPPALNAFSRLGILLANYVFIPILPEPFSYYGLGNMLSSVQKFIPLNKDFIAYKIFLSVHKSQKTNIREDFVTSLRSQLGERLFTNSIPDFVGIVERSTIKQNIFDLYNKDKATNKIKLLMEEIETLIKG